MRPHILIIALMAVGLSACASTPSIPLAQRLEGKTPEDRQETLRRACLTEADWNLDQTAARMPANMQHRHRHRHHHHGRFDQPGLPASGGH